MPDRLYPILDTAVCGERGLDPLAVLDAFLAGGARFIQLRDKSSSSAAQLALAEAAVARAHAAGGRLIVNDRADIARLSGADGVHVGQDDLPVEDARLVVGPEAIVGVSTHDEAQIDAALLTSADYVAVGPVYGTATKDTGYSARGPGLIRYAAAAARRPRDARPPVPIVAIGGITIARAPEVFAAGASAAAVISDLLSRDPEARVREYLRV